MGAESMYPNLYKGLGLRDENHTKYNTPLVEFDRKMVISAGQIKLPVVTEGKEVMVNFIVVHVLSSYTVILAQPWIHSMRVVLSTLHQKMKFPTEQGIVVVKGDQNVTQLCFVAAINHEIK